MRDEHYRSLCDFEKEYDRTIDRIKELNEYIKDKTEEEKEEFATDAVNSCIRGVVFGDAGGWLCAGGCIAVRASSNQNLPGYKKVLLGVRL